MDLQKGIRYFWETLYIRRRTANVACSRGLELIPHDLLREGWAGTSSSNIRRWSMSHGLKSKLLRGGYIGDYVYYGGSQGGF